MLVGSLLSTLTGLLGSLGLKPVADLINTVEGVVEGLPVVGPLLSALSVNDVNALNATTSAVNQTTLAAMVASYNVADASGDLQCSLEPYDPPTVIDQTFPPFDMAKANVYRYRQQQSVNLGSWFALEQWMAPSLFSCAADAKASELDVASGWGSTKDAKSVLERHWDTWITIDDMHYLASIGINTVRLPIGYWSLGPLYCKDTPFEPVADVYENSWSRVMRAINWAGEAGLGVIVDLHGAPGSQNGRPSSGVSTGTAELFTDKKNVDKTMEVLTFLVQQLAVVTNVVGIELLNEPLDVPELPDFYESALTTLRSVSPEAASLPFYIHDAYNFPRFSDFVADRKDFVVQDHHSYFMLTAGDDLEPVADHTIDVETSLAQTLEEASTQQRRNLVIGEWSCALSDDSLSNDPNPATAQQTFCQAQMEVYANTTAGWAFWSYVSEGCDENPGWCFKSAVGNLLPTTFFSYPGVSTPSVLGVAELQTPSDTEVLEPTQTSTTTTDSTPTATGLSRRSYQHRFTTIHERRMSLQRRQTDDPVADKGYSDGALTAEIYFQSGMSRLGFTGQYIADSWAKMDTAITSTGSFDTYQQQFVRGLRDTEATIFASS